MFYALAFLLHLPLLCVASPTELARRDGDTPELSLVLMRNCPHDTLSKTGNEQCISVRWHPVESTLSLKNNKDGNVIILIETVMGVVLCFVPSKDVNEMMPKKTIEDAKYRTLYTDRLLGAQGQLIRKMHEQVQWHTEGSQTAPCLPPFMIFDIQMAAPGQKSTKALHHKDLIRKMASDLKDSLRGALEPSRALDDWEIPIFLFDKRYDNTVAMWKTLQEPSLESNERDVVHVAKVWITGAYDSTKKPLIDMKLNFPLGYPDADHPRWQTFGEAEIDYQKASSEPKQATRTLLEQLYAERNSPANAEERHWMVYNNDATEVQCSHLPWSDRGTLLGYINTAASPLLMIQTSTAAIMCYFPNPEWQKVVDKGKEYFRQIKSKELYLSGYRLVRDALLDSLEEELKKVGEGLNILDSQFVVVSSKGSRNTFIKPMLKEFLTEMSKVLEAVAGDSEKSEFSVKPYLLEDKNVRVYGPMSEARYNVMWLKPSAISDLITRKVWIWKMGVGVTGQRNSDGKSPLAKLDLLKPADKDPYHYMIPWTDLYT